MTDYNVNFGRMDTAPRLMPVPPRKPAVKKSWLQLIKRAFDESQVNRAKTTTESNDGSFAPKGTAQKPLMREITGKNDPETVVREDRVHAIEREFEKSVKRFGLQKEYDAAMSNLRDLMSNTQVRINRKSLKTLFDLALGSGRMKTQFVTGTSSGSLDNKYRANAEAVLFSYPEGIYGMPAEDRPVYGTASVNDEHHTEGDPAGQYGRIQFLLRDEVAERTTFTLTDSLEMNPLSAYAPTPLRQPRISAFFTAATAYGGNDDTAPHLLDTYKYRMDERLKILATAKSMTDLASIGFGYTETQIHGGVSITDVARIRLPKSLTESFSDYGLGPWANVEAALRKRGIEIMYH